MPGSEVATFQATGIRSVDLAVRWWAQSEMLPTSYRTDRGEVKWWDLALSGLVLDALTVDPRLAIGDTYVIKGRVGFMYGLQLALIQREGYDAILTEETEERATVRFYRPGDDRNNPRHGVVVRFDIDEAKAAGWYDRNPNYKSQPRAMNAARALTKAVRHNAPGVLRGITSRTEHIAALDVGEGATSGGRASSAGRPPDALPPGFCTRLVSDHLRAELQATMAELREHDPETFAQVAMEWRSFQGPKLSDPQAVTVTHAALLRYLIDEATDARARVAADDGPTPDTRGDGPDPMTGEIPPGGYDPDDPGRPF